MREHRLLRFRLVLDRCMQRRTPAVLDGRGVGAGGEPEVQRQRGKWSSRQGGHDPPPAAGGRAARHLRDQAGGEGETLGEFLEKVWLPSKQGRVELATPDQYSWAVRRHIVPLLGAVRLQLAGASDAASPPRSDEGIR